MPVQVRRMATKNVREKREPAVRTDLAATTEL